MAMLNQEEGWVKRKHQGEVFLAWLLKQATVIRQWDGQIPKVEDFHSV
jgi:hypothetical protein